MTQEDRCKICSVCKNRSFSMNEGLLCKLSSAKPEFESECPDFEKDEAEVEMQKKQKEDSDKISGLMAFYVYWAIPIGILMTILSFFIIPRDMGYYAGSVSLILHEVAIYGFYFYFAIYTIYAFVKKKPDAVFIAKYQLIIAFIFNLLTLISGDAPETMIDNVPRVIGSLVWGLIFFLYLTYSEDVKERIPISERKLSKRNKLLFILSIVVPIFFFITFFVELILQESGYNIFASNKQKIEQICTDTNELLPQTVGDGIVWVDMTLDGEDIVYTYEYTSDAYDNYLSYSNSDDYELLGYYQGELIKHEFVYSEDALADPIFALAIDSKKYDVKYVYCSPEGKTLYSATITNEEMCQIAENRTYSTSTETFTNLLNAYNKLLPVEYMEDCMLQKCYLSEDGTVLNYDLHLVNITYGDLTTLTQSYLKSYMLEIVPYLTDAPSVIARLEAKDLAFNFTAECSDWWNVNVNLDESQYNAVFYE